MGVSEPWFDARARDSVDVAEEWVAVALRGEEWAVRDSDGQEPCFVERGTVRDGDCQRLIETPLTYLDAAIIERLLEVARAANSHSGSE